MTTVRSEAETTALIDRLIREVGGAPIGPDANFFEAGLTSALLLRIHHLLVAELGRELPVPLLFKHPTVRSLARRLSAGESLQPATTTVRTAPGRSVAESRRELRNRIRRAGG